MIYIIPLLWIWFPCPQLNPVSFSQSSSDKPSLAMRPPFLFWESYPAVQIWRRIWQTSVERLSTGFLIQFYLRSNSQWYSELPKPQPSGEQIGCFLVSLLCCLRIQLTWLWWPHTHCPSICFPLSKILLLFSCFPFSLSCGFISLCRCV